VDTRERAIISSNQLKVAFQEKQLDIGDFNIVCKKTEEVVFIIERKSISDLIASIKDGRYIEQKSRALSVYGAKKYAYVIETNRDFNWNTDEKQVRSAIINTMIRDDIPVFMSCDISDTCSLVNNIYDKFEFGQNIQRGISQNGYLSCLIKGKKSENKKDPMVLAKLQLSHIPGISLNNAEAILKEFDVDRIVMLINCFNNEEDVNKRLLSIPGIGKNKVKELLSSLML
jgi:ERCC4-type nuclease